MSENRNVATLNSAGPTLVIRLDPQTGNITVQGPVQDRLLCLGLLELAKEAIALNNRQALEAKKIQLTPAIPGLKS